MLLSRDDAFSVLGNETRIAILQALGAADEPVSFSELRDRVGRPDSGQFIYHLDQLVGHFIRKTDEGYGLLQAGQRVIEAVLSGVVTDIPDVESKRIEKPCYQCGAPTEVTYDSTAPRPVQVSCTECAGMVDYFDVEHGSIGSFQLPPAGLHGRTPRDVVSAGFTWERLEYLSAMIGLCPAARRPSTTRSPSVRPAIPLTVTVPAVIDSM